MCRAPGLACPSRALNFVSRASFEAGASSGAAPASGQGGVPQGQQTEALWQAAHLFQRFAEIPKGGGWAYEGLGLRILREHLRWEAEDHSAHRGWPYGSSVFAPYLFKRARKTMASKHFAQVLVALCALDLMGLKRRRKAIWRMRQSWTRASRIEPFERQTATQALPFRVPRALLHCLRRRFHRHRRVRHLVLLLLLRRRGLLCDFGRLKPALGDRAASSPANQGAGATDGLGDLPLGR